MKKSYRIIVSNATIRYDFTIRRNITIIKGDSATGKTTLVEMIREYYESGENSGVTLQCEKTCRTLGGRDWKTLLSAIHENIIFIDEGNDFLPTNAFAEAVRNSDNYYVIVTREGLPNLPYSVEEIYGIRESGKYASLKQTYNEFYHIYGRTDDTKTVIPEKIVVEDSNSGFEFFSGYANGKNYTVMSAGGKSNIFGILMENLDPNVLVIADGAVFGPEMDRIMKLKKQKHEIVLYLPESFEWLILKSGVVSSVRLNQILESPEEYIESSQYFSWERFFTELLVELTSDTYMKYMKRKLNEVYLHKDTADKIVNVMKKIKL